MAALVTRQAARERLLNTFLKALDKVIPEDEAVPLRGRTFAEWEEQADEFDREVTSTLMEERAALEDTAMVESGEPKGCCRHCGSDRLYLEDKHRQRELQTPHGVVVLGHQSMRCRSCNRTFSPSGA